MLQNLVSNHGLLGHFGYGILIIAFGLSFGIGFKKFWVLWGSAVASAILTDVCVRIICTCHLEVDSHNAALVIGIVYLGLCGAATLAAVLEESGGSELPIY